MQQTLKETQKEFSQQESAKKDKLEDLERELDNLAVECERNTLRVSGKQHDLRNRIKDLDSIESQLKNMYHIVLVILFEQKDQFAQRKVDPGSKAARL